MTSSKFDSILLLILRFGGFFCFAGWAWIHLYWEGPYGILFWQDETYAFAGRWGISWDDFVGTGANDGLVQVWNSRIGWLYLACSVLTLTARRKSRVQMAGLIGGSGLLVIMSFAKYLGAQRQLPMFVEHGGQMLMPVILVLALVYGVRHRATVATAMVAVVMVFAGHGAYALGYHWPTPANFFAMTSVILNVESGTVWAFLRVAGILDFIVCVGLFIRPMRQASALYAAVWGLLTALARPMAGMATDLNFWGADQFLHEVAIRAPHFLLPLFLFLVWRGSTRSEKETASTGGGEESDDPQTGSL